MPTRLNNVIGSLGGRAGGVLGPRFLRQVGQEEETQTRRVEAEKVLATRAGSGRGRK